MITAVELLLSGLFLIDTHPVIANCPASYVFIPIRRVMLRVVPRCAVAQSLLSILDLPFHPSLLCHQSIPALLTSPRHA
ncbi:hypothetical protein QBC35DRAFT_215308 [Podospora australis]|uniref:Secreted protein n=1 Tax=Podospora australis TaxID=1536484 RepID=A0AAN6WU04_9PEZI|nr:hypothetical protein QBC35DRAFT_215308 [Podospora australis]